jgi:hypothetical protein
LKNCDVCEKPVEHGQVSSGVPLADGSQVIGHYQCVVDFLGPERELEALERGFLPKTMPPLINGREPKWAAKAELDNKEGV